MLMHSIHARDACVKTASKNSATTIFRCGLALAFAVTFACASRSACALVLTVGSEANCSFSSIQAAIDWAAQSPDPDKYIALVRDETYTEHAIHVDNMDLTISGGFSFCGSADLQGTSTIDGSGGADAPIITITGASNVHLQLLYLTGGHAGASGTGGGINFLGSTLHLIEVTVTASYAGYGGGIYAGGGSAYFDSDVLIDLNTAQTSGGGIRVYGGHLFVTQQNTLIGYNHALDGYGGGISVAGGDVSISSPGYSGLPVVFFNSAPYGGGISIEAVGDPNFPFDANVELFTTDPDNPVAVDDNWAFIAGGGVYLKSFSAVGPDGEVHALANLNAWNFRIDDNIAAEGAALYLDWDSSSGGDDWGSVVSLNPLGQDPPDDAVPCAAGVPCNEISGNLAEDSNGQPTDGAVFLVGTSSVLSTYGLAMHGNVANYLIDAIGDNDNGVGGVFLRNCLTGANDIARELIRMQGGDAPLSIIDCTLAPDIINSTHVIKFDNGGGNSLTLESSIVDEPGTLTLNAPGNLNVITNYVLSNDTSSLPANATVIAGQPRYVGIDAGDYHLRATSIGIDFAPANGGTDLDGNRRDVDLPGIPNLYGPRDLGAYERQTLLLCSADTIFCDGFDG